MFSINAKHPSDEAFQTGELVMYVPVEGDILSERGNVICVPLTLAYQLNGEWERPFPHREVMVNVNRPLMMLAYIPRRQPPVRVAVCLAEMGPVFVHESRLRRFRR